MSNGPSVITTDISSCDQEPVRFISAIQDHAVFFTFSKGDYRIQNFSQNIERLFSSEDVLHKRINEFPFGRAFMPMLEYKIKSEEWNLYQEVFYKQEYQERTFEVHVFENDGLIACEIESLHWLNLPDDFIPGRVSLRQSNILTKFKAKTDISNLGKDLCQEIRNITGLERVMLYKFSPEDWHGEVIAEDKVASAHSFMGHHFPASDIPKTARELYLRNRVRYIADSEDKGSPVTPVINSATGKIIDLSDSKTRAVSQVHLDYLVNMGVKTSYSVAITVHDELWGLIACHSPEKIFVGQDVRILCENIAEAFAIAVPLIEELKSEREITSFNDLLFSFFDKAKNGQNPLEFVFKNFKQVLELFSCDGFAYIHEDNVDLVGFTPTKNDLLEIASWLRASFDQNGRSIIAIESLASIDKRWEKIGDLASGALAMKVDGLNNALFILFRREFVSTVVWGGDPRKLEMRNYGGSINPRKSFESWQEVIRHTSTKWYSFEVNGARNFKTLLFDSLIVNEKRINELKEKLLNRKESL